MPGDAETQRRHEHQLDEQDILLSAIDKKLSALVQDIPHDFKERFLTVEAKVSHIAETLDKNYVSRNEFVVLKTEHDQIKTLVYGFIVTVVVGFIGTLLVLVGWKR
jgi:ribosomal protein L16 Arg81 hydroxylase